MQDRTRSGREGGFSLVELLVVITIIGILATTVTVKVVGVMSQARIAKAKAEISEIKKAAGMYETLTGKHPEQLSDLTTALDKNGGQPLLDIGESSEFLDPWHTPYEYTYDRSKKKVVVKSLGADKQPGGDGEDADIDSENLMDKDSGGK